MARDPFKFITFEQGVDRIEAAWKKIGGKFDTSKVTTSRDDSVRKIIESLKIKGMEKGFEKWQLPVFFGSGDGAQFFITSAEPNARVGKHSHNNGDAMRFIVSGSITHNGVKLSKGDWMFIPKDVEYELAIGPRGATMCYCYACCCVPV